MPGPAGRHPATVTTFALSSHIPGYAGITANARR